MARPRTRTVWAVVTDGANRPVVEGQVKTQTTELVSYGGEQIVVDRTSYVETDSTVDNAPPEAVDKKLPGKFRVELVCTEDLANPVKHKIFFPDDDEKAASAAHNKEFILEYGSGAPLELGDAILASLEIEPVIAPEIFGSFVDNRIAEALDNFEGGAGGGTVDQTIIDGSAHAVSGNAVFDALAGKQSALAFTPENAANKNQPNGYAGLNSGNKLPPSLIPDTDSLTEGANNKFFTAVRTYAAQIGSISLIASAVALGDSLGTIVGKLQAQITGLFTSKAEKRAEYAADKTATSFELDETMLGKIQPCTNSSDITVTIGDDLGAGFNVGLLKTSASANRILFTTSGDVVLIFPTGHTRSDSFRGAFVSLHTPNGRDFYISGATAA